MSCDRLAIVRHQKLAIWLEELFHPFPRISDQARCRASSFENAGGWRKSVARHAVPANVQHGAGGAVKSIVVPGIDVAQVTNVVRQRFSLPTIAAEQERFRWQHFRRSKEELLNPLFSIREAIGQKSQVAGKSRIPGR